MLLWKLQLCNTLLGVCYVSILVLLDVALKASNCVIPCWVFVMFQSLFSWMLLWKSSKFNMWTANYRFQSLFSWMLLWKLTGHTGLCIRKLVSILVLLDVALKVGLRGVDVQVLDGFQSLFSWMLLWKTGISPGPGALRKSFNPCSLGCCSESRVAGLRVDPPLEFQSLFSWMLLWKLHEAQW